MNMILRRLLVWVVLFGFSLCGWADGDDLHRSISMKDGLPSNTVRNIVQDKYGYMWLGTDNGLCRYDGLRVVPHRIADCGLNQYVSALLATDEGIYVGTEGGVYLLRFNSAFFERLPLDIHSVVSCVTLDAEGCLWVSTTAEGVWHYTPTSHQVRHYDFPQTQGFVSQVFIDNARQVWTVSNRADATLNRLNRSANQFEEVRCSYPTSYNALRMLQTHDGRMWLGTWEEGLLLLSNGRLEQVLSPKDSKVGQHIHTLYERADGTICIGCDDGLICFDPQIRQWHRAMEQKSQNDRFVYAIASDNENGLWLGTFYGGVIYISPLGRRFEGFTMDQGLAGNVISRFCEDGQGRIWIASDDGGLMCYSPQEQRFTDYRHRDDLASANVHALALKGQELWIGTYTRGIYVLNLTTGTLRHYTHSDQPNSLSGTSSYAILHDGEGRTWVGTMDGLDLYDPSVDGFTQVRSLGALTIDIDEDNNHRLWLSTQGNGLWEYNPETKAFRQFLHHDDDAHSLPSNEVNSLLIDQSGRIWVGTAAGLCRYDADKEQFQTVALGIETSQVMSIIEEQGVLWLSTDHGIVSYDPSKPAASTLRFTRHDGLVGEQFQPNAGLKLSDGRICFGSVNGFNTFFPHDIKANTVLPPVYITSQQTAYSYDEAKTLTLSFVALSYCSPEKNQYACMLEGYDDDWNYLGNRHQATYTNLPAGTYTFRVKATNNDGLWTDSEATLTFTVHPPFWWTWQAKVFYLLLIAGLIGLLMFIRKKQSKDAKRSKKNVVALNTGALSDIPSEPGEGGSQADREFMDRLTKIIEDNIANSDLSVGFLADQMGISRSGLFARVKTLADTTPNEMIQVIRLKKAARMLREGRYLVSEVGYKVGFSNPSYFSKCFQKQFGIRPADYIKKPIN